MAGLARIHGGNGLTLEIIEGLSEHASRAALKGMFSTFGDVQACWVPPVDRRHVDNGSLRFATAEAAEAAKQACDAGQVFFQGMALKVKWRMGGGPRVGNSDIGGTVNNRSPTPERTKWRRGEYNRPERAQSRSHRRSRSRRRRKKSRSPSRRLVRSKNVFGREPDKEALRELEMQRLEMEAAYQRSALQPLALPPADYGRPDPAALVAAVAAAAAEAGEKERRTREAQEKRAALVKRGPGVAALVQGALKKAQTLAQEKDREPEFFAFEEKTAADNRKRKLHELRKSGESPDRFEREQRQREEKKEREAREAQERKLRLEHETQEKREQAKRQAEQEAADRARLEEETREARIKAGIETAKRQQAAREKRAAGKDNLYGDMPEPDLDPESEMYSKRAQAAAAASSVDLSLPMEDCSKVVFLDIDGVLRPARAGGFDIVSVDGAQATNPDTSDFFPSSMKALKHIIERTGAIVVLSSEWRRDDALRNAIDAKLTAQRLRPCSAATRIDLKHELGSEDPLRSFAQRRAREITAWLEQHEGEVKGWVVLDDINLSIADDERKASAKPMGPKLVQTWPLCGLTMGNAKTAVRILNGEMIHKVLVERPKAPGGSGASAATAGARG